MVNCLIFAFCCFLFCQKWCLQNFYWIEKFMVLETVDKNVFEIITLQNNLVLFAGLRTIILCSVHSAWFVKYAFSAKIWFWKISARIKTSTNYKLLNQTLQMKICIFGNKTILGTIMEVIPSLSTSLIFSTTYVWKKYCNFYLFLTLNLNMRKVKLNILQAKKIKSCMSTWEWST